MKRNYISVALAIILVLTVVLSFVACGKGASPEPTATSPGVTDTEVLVGATGAFSGIYGFIGQLQVQGSQTYLNYINDQGGINGRKIRYITYDDGFDAARTVAGVKRLVEQDQVFCLFNGGSSGALINAKEYCVENGIPYFGGITNDLAAVMPIVPGFFLTTASYYQAGQLMVKYMVDTLGIKKLAFLGLSLGNALEGRAAMLPELDKRGIKLLVDLQFAPAEIPSDYTPIVTKLKDAGVEGVFIWAFLTAQDASFLKTAHAMNYRPVLIDRQPGGVNEQFITLAGADAEGAYTTTYIEPLGSDIKGIQDFKSRFEKYYPDQVSKLQYGHEATYLNAMVFCEALNKAGRNPTRTGFNSAVESIKNYNTGISPPITFGPKQHYGMSALGLTQVKNGKLVRVGDWVEVGPAPEGVVEKLGGK